MVTDWYERRNELMPGQIFRTETGDIVKLDRRVPGDGTDWYADIWMEGHPSVPGYEQGHFSCEDYRIHPGDLTELLPDSFNGNT